MLRYLYCFCCSILLCYPTYSQTTDTLRYVFFGHTYAGGEPEGKRVDFRLEAMDMNQFDRIWLGGDIGAETDLNYSNLAYLDTIFDLKKAGNHWALGNHDTRNENIEWIEEFSGKERYYAYTEHSITTIVMDGNISPLDCENLNKQFELIKQVCDTINQGYLIFLVHHGIATDVPGVASPLSYAHTELQNWLPNCYSDTLNYANSIYPLLQKVESRGIDVFHITGDVGSYYKQYHGISDHGVEYLAAGLGNGYRILQGLPIHAPDVAIVFTHILPNNQLSWEFVLINDL